MMRLIPASYRPQGNPFAAQASHCIPKGIQQLHLLRIIAPRCLPKATRCTNADADGPGVASSSEISSYGIGDSKLETLNRTPEPGNHRGREELAKGTNHLPLVLDQPLIQRTPTYTHTAIYASRYTYSTCSKLRTIPSINAHLQTNLQKGPGSLVFQTLAQRKESLDGTSSGTVLQGF